MENNYVCKYGLYHDKPVNNMEPRSNNGWIYTAYKKKLFILLYSQRQKIKSAYESCVVTAMTDSDYCIYRLPGKKYPPISRDEIIGMYSLGFDPLKNYGWAMYRETHKPDYWLAIKTLWRIRKEHRNYFWEQHQWEAYPIAMKLWWHDRYYINKMQNKKCSIWQYICFKAYQYSITLKGTAGEKNLLALQLDDLGMDNSYLDIKRNLLEYFGPDHIFNRINYTDRKEFDE